VRLRLKCADDGLAPVYAGAEDWMRAMSLANKISNLNKRFRRWVDSELLALALFPLFCVAPALLYVE
jgi:hypothetical protein